MVHEHVHFIYSKNKPVDSEYNSMYLFCSFSRQFCAHMCVHTGSCVPSKPFYRPKSHRVIVIDVYIDMVRPSLGWTIKPPYRTFYSEANLAARPEQKCGCLPFPLARTEHFRGEGWCSTREPKNPGGYGYTPSISCQPASLV
jgi:hypothetical protein